MFRGGFFEYAGIDSSIYDLHLVRIGSGQEDVASGGEYELKVDTIPKSPNQLLYGLNYSESPLEFEVEMCTDGEVIPLEQEIEIKNWLFAQNGWKTFTVIDEGQHWHLKCMFIPEEDIMSGEGLRGFRCTLKNCSPFWYGDPVERIYGNGTQNIQSYYYSLGNEDPIKVRDVYKRPEDDAYVCWAYGSHRYIVLNLDIPNNVVNTTYCPEIEITTVDNSSTNEVTLSSDSWVYVNGVTFKQEITDSSVTTSSNIEYTCTPTLTDFDVECQDGTVVVFATSSGGTVAEFDDAVFNYTVFPDNPQFTITNISDYPSSEIMTEGDTETIQTYMKSMLNFQNGTDHMLSDTININSRYVVFKTENDTSDFSLVTKPTSGGLLNSHMNQWLFPTLSLGVGKNNLYVYPCKYIYKLIVRYTPMYRLGAF